MSTDAPLRPTMDKPSVRGRRVQIFSQILVGTAFVLSVAWAGFLIWMLIRLLRSWWGV
jgi:hypothetical protein